MGGSRRASENSKSKPHPVNAADEAVNGRSQTDFGAGVADRRVVPDRRLAPGAGSTGLERRRGPGRRRTDFTRAAEEGEMTGEQFLFLMAIDVFKRVNDKTFPSWSDVLEIIRRLGYRKVQGSQISVPQAEDWTEPADAPLWPQPRLGPEAEEEGPEALDDAA
ncbi:MAG: hypothetical protein IT430_05940 [Phycisphaerales bacterium]|nr:hypothetical protein [Phycisphaerales bacterium]